MILSTQNLSNNDRTLHLKRRLNDVNTLSISTRQCFC